jgi:Poly(ADP-ribose) polymerase catalytic domain
MRCGDVCAASADGGACRTCAEIKEEMRVARVAARAADAREAVERARELAVAVAEVERGNVRLDPGDSEFERIVEQIARTTQPGHGVTIRAKAIYKLENAARERKHFEAVGNMLDPSTHATQLFHGTATKNVGRILAEGFRVARNRASAGPASHAKNMLGAAVYLCPDASKAASKEYLGGATGVLLLCDVLLGSVKEVVAADEELDSPERQRHERYDSVVMRRTTAGRKTGVLYDEYAVYDQRLVLPRYAIEVEISAGAPVGPFRMLPRIEDGAEFFDITFADVERLGLDAPTPEAHHFFKAQALCTQLSAQAGSDFAGKKLARLTFCRNPRLEELFDHAARTLEARGLPFEASFVFHGTPEAKIPLIQGGGFKLPGVEVGIANGTSFGNGIYLGLTPELSQGYARGSQSLLLVKVLRGRNKRQPLGLDDCRSLGKGPDFPVVAGAYQSFEPGNNMLIVASSVMTLPCYVVHWA